MTGGNGEHLLDKGQGVFRHPMAPHNDMRVGSV